MYSIGVASRLSGVPTETIRIWERRYGLPNPGRTVGGHRLYSDDDVELLRAVKHLVDRGIRVGGLAGTARDDLLRMAFGEDGSGQDPAAPARPEPQSEFDAFIEAGVDAARALDSDRLADLLSRPLSRWHASQVVRELYLPLLREIGELWHEGKISIAAEHLVEKQISGRIHTVLANRRPPGVEAPSAVCACVAGERHEVGLLASAVLLHEAGFRVLYLGSDLPADDLLSVLRHVRPRLMVLASMMEMAPADEKLLQDIFPDPAFRNTTLVLGGQNGPALALRMPWQPVVCETLDQLIEIAQTVSSQG